MATITQMAFVAGDRPVRPLTAEEVMRMVAAGILGEDERVELLHGVLTAVSPEGTHHAEIKTRLVRWLAGPRRHVVRVECPLIVPDRTSLPQPDIAVVEARDYLEAHPEGALLVVEVAVSSLATDAKVKPALYAAAGVPDYWLVDVEAKRVHTYREPQTHGYGAHTVLGPDAVAAPLAVDVPPLDLAELFRGI